MELNVILQKINKYQKGGKTFCVTLVFEFHDMVYIEGAVL